MKTLRFIGAFIASFALAPFTTYAAPQDFKELINMFLVIINLLIPFVIGLTFIIVLWGIAKAWIWNPGQEESVRAGKNLVIAAIIGFTVMIGVWGILSIVRESLFGG